MSSRHRQSAAQAASSRRPNAPPAGTSRTSIGDANVLPPYKKPSHPLNAAAQAKLREIYGGRTFQLLEDHSNKAADHITTTAGVLNDHLRERTEIVERQRKKWQQGTRVAEQEEQEEGLRKFKEEVEDITARLEKGVRDAIDDGAAATRIKESLTWLRENAHRQMEDEFATQMTQREQSQAQSSGPTPGPTPLNQERIALTGLAPMFHDRMDKKKDEYYSFTHTARYAKNNRYIGFKATVHDAVYGDDGPPLPLANTWFAESGPPAPGITATQAGDEDDDDIIVDKAKVSTRCPITFQQFKEPYTSKKCPHTFEKTAILAYIRNTPHKTIECPVPGCSQSLTANDLHSDLVLIRKIKRMQAAEAQGAEESESEEEEEVAPQRRPQVDGADADDRATASATPMRHPPASANLASAQRPSKPSQILDLGDPSDSDDDDE